MKDINTSLVTLKTVIDEDGSFTFIITPSITLSSPDTFRWEITFGQGVLYRGVITFKAGESDSRSILKSIDPDEHYQFRVYRVSDNNNAADDELLFQQQSKTTPPSFKDVQPHEAPQQAGVEVKGEQETDITPRVVPEVVNPEEDNVIDLSDEMAPQKIDGGDGSDTITGGAGDDQIEGGAGDDEIILSSNAEEDSGADEVLYTFGYDGVGLDGGM